MSTIDQWASGWPVTSVIGRPAQSFLRGGRRGGGEVSLVDSLASEIGCSVWPVGGLAGWPESAEGGRRRGEGEEHEEEEEEQDEQEEEQEEQEEQEEEQEEQEQEEQQGQKQKGVEERGAKKRHRPQPPLTDRLTEGNGRRSLSH